MIKFTHISKKYDNGNYGLKDVSFKIEQGEFVYVVGKSGAGKSTLLKMFNREDMPTSGEILMGNVKISRLKNDQVYKLRRQVGVIRQKDLFLPNRSAYENVEYVLSACEVPREEWDKRILDAFTTVGMWNFREHRTYELSIGQQKKIAIARAIVTSPPILIADEATANLDNRSAMDVMKLFNKINRQGMTVVFATHDSTMVNTLRRRTLELSYGNLIRDDKKGGYSATNDPKNVYVW